MRIQALDPKAAKVRPLNFALALASPNVRAFLRVIREGESSQDDELAYRLRYHPRLRGVTFEGFEKHPEIFELIPDGSGRKSSAAGAYQITATTWRGLVRLYGFRDFGPYSQDCAAVALIFEKGALDDIIDGRLEQTIAKCGPVWASLPGSSLRDGGGKISLARAREVFLRYGGAFARAAEPPPALPAPLPQPVPMPQPIPLPESKETPKMGPLAFLLPLVQSLLEIFTPIAKARLSKALAKVAGDDTVATQMAEQIIGIAQQATGLADPVEAVAAVKADARKALEVQALAVPPAEPPSLGEPPAPKPGAIAAKVESGVVDYLDRIGPVIDRLHEISRDEWEASERSMDLASVRAATDPTGGQDKVLTFAILALAAAVLVTLGGALALLIYFNKPYGEVLALFAAGVGTVWAKFGTRYDHRYGSSRSSAAKDVVIEELAAARNQSRGYQ